ncbi:GLPGLI family protein [Winogradskyella pacifica]|uniref:GLPGLI family protein n=1 Tax=Winogradskyella pacifica TaxID=664642 RepID=A0A3D9N7K1_9FLAO|nr:GLPGLI family protein [Winogradskyella pacifica]REE27805.1 GLPGLI family protein [Winogradskyella pacifica]
MIYKQIFTIVLITLFQLSFSQISGNAHYYKVSNYKIGGIGVSKNSKEPNKTIDSSISEIDFVIKFNDSLAVYEKLNKDDSFDAIVISHSGYNGPFFYEIKQKKAVKEQGKYLIEKAFDDYNWVLTDDIMIIDSLVCYKATSTIKIKGRRSDFTKPVTAWYAPEICLPVGPDGFAGLPGIIVELKIDKVTTRLKKINFTDKDVIIELPKNKKRMTETKFDSFIEGLIASGNEKN